MVGQSFWGGNMRYHADTKHFVLQSIGRRKAFLLFLTVCVMSILDLCGIAIIFPFLQVIMQPDYAQNLLLKIRPLGFDLSTLQHSQFCILLGICLVFFYIAKNLCQVLLTKFQMRVLARFTADITNDLVALVLNTRYAIFQEIPISQIAGTAYHNTVHASLALNALMQIATEGALLASLLVIFFAYQPMLALGALGLAATVSYLVYITIVRRTSRLGRAQTNIENVRYRLLFSIANAIRDIKIMGLNELFEERSTDISNDYSEIAWRYNLNNSLPRILIELVAFVSIIVAALAIVLLKIPLERAGPLLGVAAIAALRVAPALSKIFNALNGFKFSHAFIAKIIELRASLLQSQVHQIEDKLQFNHTIELKDVEFHYGTDRILSNICMQLKRHEAIGIVGQSGGGKTTLLDLITGLQQATAGQFLCDGIAFDPFTSKSIQKFIGYVPQIITLLDDTIAFNISFEEKPDPIRLQKSLNIANLTSFIASLPKGVGTQVGENGIRLSGGQRQRIGIARAVYRRPRILVFDEATSSLDTVTEAELSSEIEKMRSQMSVIIVAHRLSTVRSCDRIYVLAAGKIEACGTHEELLVASPTYQKLQFSQTDVETE